MQREERERGEEEKEQEQKEEGEEKEEIELQSEGKPRRCRGNNQSTSITSRHHQIETRLSKETSPSKKEHQSHS